MEKFKLGFLDEDAGIRASFLRLFKNDFEVVILDDKDKIKTPSMLLQVIDDLNLDALAVDFKLADSGWIPYNGNNIISAAWQSKRYFPIFMLTSYPDEALQKVYNSFIINDKEKILTYNTSENEQLQFLIKQIKAAIDNYKKLVSAYDRTLRKLELKQRSETLSEQEESKLLALRVDMHHMDPLSNPIRADMLQSSALNSLNKMVELSNSLLKKLENK